MANQIYLPLRCPKCQKMHEFVKADFVGKTSVPFICECGHSQAVTLPSEDVNQAAARIIREATERD